MIANRATVAIKPDGALQLLNTIVANAPETLNVATRELQGPDQTAAFRADRSLAVLEGIV